MTGIMCGQFMSGTGGGYLDTQTVTVGYYDNFDPIFSVIAYGYSVSIPAVTTGSVSDGTFNPISNAPIYELNFSNYSGGTYVYFTIAGNYSNSGWTSMDVAGTTFTRASGTFSSGGGLTQWYWLTATNPFGTTSGATKIVNFS